MSLGKVPKYNTGLGRKWIRFRPSFRLNREYIVLALLELSSRFFSSRPESSVTWVGIGVLWFINFYLLYNFVRFSFIKYYMLWSNGDKLREGSELRTWLYFPMKLFHRTWIYLHLFVFYLHVRNWVIQDKQKFILNTHIFIPYFRYLHYNIFYLIKISLIGIEMKLHSNKFTHRENKCASFTLPTFFFIINCILEIKYTKCSFKVSIS